MSGGRDGSSIDKLVLCSVILYTSPILTACDPIIFEFLKILDLFTLQRYEM